MIQESPQLHTLPANVRKFWEEKQQTLQETLLRFSYGVLVEPGELILREKSGLIYLMDRNLWFEDFPKNSTFASLFQQGIEYTKTHVHFPRHSITHIRLVPAAEVETMFLSARPSSAGILGFFRLFKPRPNTLVMDAVTGEGRAAQVALRDLDDPDMWYRLLTESEQSPAYEEEAVT